MNLLTRLSSSLLLTWGFRANLIAFLSGVALSFALAPFDIWPLAFLAFPVFVLLLDGAAADGTLRSSSAVFRRGFARGWSFGFGYFLASLWWIAMSFLVDGGLLLIALPFAMVVLPVGLAVFFGIGTGIALLFWRGGPQRLFILAAMLGGAEWLRGHVMTGFPWNLLGMPAMPTPIAMQSASVIGIYGVTLLAIFVFCLPVLAVQTNSLGHQNSGGKAPSKTGAVLCMIVGVAFVTGHVGFGAYRLSAYQAEFYPDIKLRVVQPNLNQKDKWNPLLAAQNFQTYLDLSNVSTSPTTASADAFTHIIWPETAFPFFLTEQPDAILSLANLLSERTVLITGAIRRDAPAQEGEAPRVYNTIYAIDGSGEIIAAQDKVRLVPFGEFIPLTGFLDAFGLAPAQWKEFGFSAGTQRAPFALPGTPLLLPLICYEVIFTSVQQAHETVLPVSQTATDAAEGPASADAPAWYVNVTNDAWYGNTPGPYQHLRLTQLRAASDGVAIVRAANTGISAIIGPTGDILKRIDLQQIGVIDGELPLPYANAGPNWRQPLHFWALWLALFVAGIMPYRWLSRTGS
jgi:apolipoprotein N-acyltransferase